MGLSGTRRTPAGSHCQHLSRHDRWSRAKGPAICQRLQTGDPCCPCVTAVGFAMSHADRTTNSRRSDLRLEPPGLASPYRSGDGPAREAGEPVLSWLRYSRAAKGIGPVMRVRGMEQELTEFAEF